MSLSDDGVCCQRCGEVLDMDEAVGCRIKCPFCGYNQKACGEG